MERPEKSAFEEQLEKDAEMFRQAADAWRELQRHGARLEDLDGRQVATAAEMIELYCQREKELRDLIKKVKGE